MVAWDKFTGRNPEIRLIRNPTEGDMNNSGYTGPEVADLEWLHDQVPQLFSVHEIDSKGNETPELKPISPKSPNLLRRMLNFLKK